jgi:hypothetical protein
MATSKKKIVFYGSHELDAKIRKAADNFGMSASALINQCMNESIDKLLQTSELIKLAAKDASAAELQLLKLMNEAQLDLLKLYSKD